MTLGKSLDLIYTLRQIPPSLTTLWSWAEGYVVLYSLSLPLKQTICIRLTWEACQSYRCQGSIICPQPGSLTVRLGQLYFSQVLLVIQMGSQFEDPLGIMSIDPSCQLVKC